MTTKKANSKDRSSSKIAKKLSGKVILGIVVAWGILWILGVPQLSFNYARCRGRMPVTHTSSFLDGFAAGRGSGYLIPSDESYYRPPYFWSTTYYCTEQEAIDDNLTPDITSNYWSKIPSDTIFSPEKARHD